MVSIDKFYEHQDKYYKALVEKECEGFHSIICIPTGGGKTRLAVTYAINNVLKKGKKVLWITHSKYLLNQAYSTFGKLLDNTEWMNNYGIIVHSESPYRTSDIRANHQLICISFQSLLRTNVEWKQIIGEDVTIIIDEAHHVIAESYMKVIENFSTGKTVLGLTATPIRSKSTESNELYRYFETDLGVRIHISDLFKRKILVIPDFEEVEFSIDTGEINNIDDLSNGLLNEIENYNQLIFERYISNVKKYGKTVIFAINKKHVDSLYQLFSQHEELRDKVYRVYSGLPDREAQFEQFAKSEDGILININIMNEGVDIPDIKTVFMTKPSNSKITVTQIIGRALRKYEGKECAYIVNFAVGNLGRKFLIVTPKLTYRLYKAEWDECDDELDEIEMEEKNMDAIAELVEEHISKKATCSFSNICLAGHYTIIDGENCDIPVPVSFIEYIKIEKYIGDLKAGKTPRFLKKMFFCDECDCVKEYIDESIKVDSEKEIIFTKYDDNLFESYKKIYAFAQKLKMDIEENNMCEKEIRTVISDFYKNMNNGEREYSEMRYYLSQIGAKTENQFVRLIRNELARVKYE